MTTDARRSAILNYGDLLGAQRITAVVYINDLRRVRPALWAAKILRRAAIAERDDPSPAGTPVGDSSPAAAWPTAATVRTAPSFRSESPATPRPSETPQDERSARTGVSVLPRRPAVSWCGTAAYTPR